MSFQPAKIDKIVILAVNRDDGSIHEVVRADEIGNATITSGFDMKNGERLFTNGDEQPRPRRIRGVNLKKISLSDAVRAVLREDGMDAKKKIAAA